MHAVKMRGERGVPVHGAVTLECFFVIVLILLLFVASGCSKVTANAVIQMRRVTDISRTVGLGKALTRRFSF